MTVQTCLFRGLVTLAVVSSLVTPVHAQTLYGLEFNAGTQFAELNITTGADVSVIGNATALNDSKGIAMDPISGLMYALNNDGGTIGLYTIHLTTAATSLVALVSDGASASPSIRDITFDSSGQMWGVTGRFGDDATSVIPVNKATAVTGAVLATTLGDRQQTIAYRTVDDLLYVYSSSGVSSPRFFQSIDPSTGTSTPIALSGTGPSVRLKGMVYDPAADLFRLFEDNGNYFTVSPTGVQTDTGNSNATIYMGLAFDQATTVPVELMSFSIE